MILRWTQGLLLMFFSTFHDCIGTTEKEKIVGIAGFKVALPCNITPPSPNDELLLILWYRGDTSNPLYTMDARRGVTNHTRHSSADGLSGRAYFSIVDRPAVLILEPVYAADAGTYKCRVDFRIARTRYSKAELSVIVPPKKPIITDGKENVLESLIGPYNEGDSLTLVCESEGGNPPSSVIWWRDSMIVDDSFHTVSQSIVQNIFVIKTLNRRHLMATFSCQASNNNQSPPVSTTVTIDMNFKPLAVWIENSNRPLSTQKPSKLVCIGIGSRPTAQLTWWIGGKKLESAKKTSPFDDNHSENKTISVLILKPNIEDNGRYLSCRAENPLIPKSEIESGWKLDVHYIPQLTLRLGSKLRHSHIQEGNDVYLECKIRSNPPSSEIVWRFDGHELSTNTSAGIIISNQSLVLQKVKRSNRGHYTCSALNSEGRGESNTVFLRVQYKPQCKNDQRFLYGTSKNEAVNVSCGVEADPPDVRFRWKFNNSGHVVDIQNYYQENSRSLATYTPRTQYDYGSLLCWATNAAGSQDIPCVFSIIPAGAPDPPKNCTVVNKSESSFRIECLEGYNGGLPQYFTMEVRDKYLESVLLNLTTKQPVFTVDGLRSGKTFVVTISSVNVRGRSHRVMLKPNTLHVPETLTHKDAKWSAKVSPVLIVLSGLTGGLLLVVIIVFLILRYRNSNGHQSKEGILKNDTIPNRYGKNDHNFTDMSSQKCPDIIPGENQLRNFSRYEDFKKDYDSRVEDNWPDKDTIAPDTCRSQVLEMVPPRPSSVSVAEGHQTLLKTQFFRSPVEKPSLTENISSPVCIHLTTNKSEAELTLVTRETD
ncbi:nephrin-like isoform X2 [Limulus polyphemus]|uniref:Nephrin-like isoform X2 n=1 Tax=Limulus polyphemus TaxID=6850 RepID=A0ABM1SP17_LIMPO|nr:nephrin-like isoform X2 [Limulus polyphemus]